MLYEKSVHLSILVTKNTSK